MRQVNGRGNKRKWLLMGVLLLVLWYGNTYIVEAAETIQKAQVTEDPLQLYKAYHNFSFPLMTKEAEGLPGFTKLFANLAVGIKNVMWSLTLTLGKMNATSVGFLFSLNILKPFQTMITSITSLLAGSVMGIATTVGVSIVSMVMVLKYAMEQNMRRVWSTLLLAVLVVTALSTLKDDGRANKVTTLVTEVDTAVANAFATVNPTLEGDTDNQSYTSGQKMRANIFKANVVVPYLTLNYGTSDLDKINEKTITYQDQTYNRAELLMGNADSAKVSDDFVSDVAKIEYDDLNNHHVGYRNSMTQAGLALFFALLNLFQFVVYILLFVLKSMLGFLLLFLMPLSVVLLLYSLFTMNFNPFKNLAKGFFTVILFKGLTTFLVVFYASYMILAYRISDKYDNAFQKIAIILVMMLLPLVIYIWRNFLFSLMQATFTDRPTNGKLMAGQFFTPRTAPSQKEWRKREAKRQDRKDGKDGKNPSASEEEKKKQSRMNNVLRRPRAMVMRMNRARQQWQEQQQTNRAERQEAGVRTQESQARKDHAKQEQAYRKVWDNMPVGEGKHGAMSPRQVQRQQKRDKIEAKHAARRQAEQAMQEASAYREATRARGQQHQKTQTQHMNQKRVRRQNPAARPPTAPSSRFSSHTSSSPSGMMNGAISRQTEAPRNAGQGSPRVTRQGPHRSVQGRPHRPSLGSKSYPSRPTSRSLSGPTSLPASGPSGGQKVRQATRKRATPPVHRRPAQSSQKPVSASPKIKRRLKK